MVHRVGRDWRRRAAALVVCAVWAGAPAGAHGAEAPDLVPELRQDLYPGQVAPVYMDAFEEPGRLLYRFDATLRNMGGTLDLYRDTGTGKAMQAVWAGGEPSETPDPNEPPTSSDATLIDLGARGARFEYVFEKTHEHWHFFSAARYELELPDGSSRISDKVGFCLFDGFDGAGGSSLYFPTGYTGSGPQTWCAFDHPESGFVRMGLSPGAADRYASQREFQWIDVAGLLPGTYRLRATANPNDSIVEADTDNNVLSEPRVVPGVQAADAWVARARRSPVTVDLTGQVVAPEVPARRSADCTPSALAGGCYVTAAAAGPLEFRIVRNPRHGTVAISAPEGLRATASYIPTARYFGRDSFEYTATDARGLESPPAVVTIEGIAPPRRATKRLIAGLALRRRGSRWYAVIRLTAKAKARGRLDRTGGRHRLVRRIATRRLARGRRRIWLGPLKPGRYRLRLGVSAVDGRRRTASRRFRAITIARRGSP